MDSKIKEAKITLENILAELDQSSMRLYDIKEPELEKDLFTQLDLLSQLDKSQAVIFSQLPKLKKYHEELKTLKNSSLSSDQLSHLNSFQAECQQVLDRICPKLESVEECYQDLAEEVLYRCQNHINQLIDKILEHRKASASLKDIIGLELDEENELRELRDSLETYREIRLGDIGESEDDQDDPLITQLDSQIVACDNALLIDETSL
ncbi:hypothetical protein [Parachlamydia sp. AcF125]|uniref:hypothetical protein n=1 Tax=Parachlamydia sp. AcF125 TaxID=2795736 RepID=UPI001BCA4664|nr:hypothetical protein [Parachlamydia sp. AcF125]MBS4169243.1 hypothetical protein [Parachlamydia sp. AcF125]